MTSEGSLFDVLPNEALVKVFKFLDAKNLIHTQFVCHRWNSICSEFEHFLWRRMCNCTQRISGPYSKQVASEYAKQCGWKKTYFSISQADLTKPPHASDLVDEVANLDAKDTFRKIYRFAKGLEMFPHSACVYQAYADFLAERPDIGDTWKLADELYTKGVEIASTYKQENRRTHLFVLFKYAQFLATNFKNLSKANTTFVKVIRMVPGNVWLLERYCEFLVESMHKYNLADKLFRVILQVSPTGSSLATYSLFLWHIRRNYVVALNCVKVACEVDPDKIYFLTNFLGRHSKDEHAAKLILEQSKLYKHLQEHPDDENALFSIALAYHQIHCVDEAEELYRKCLRVRSKKFNPVYILSNLSELLVHSRFAFEEAEKLYMEGLEAAGGYHETIQVALAGLWLAKGERDKGMQSLRELLRSSYIQAAKCTYTEGCILYLIHCDETERRAALERVKYQLVTEWVRPKLILMFNANLEWAKQNRVPDWQWLEIVAQVYNGETDITKLDDWADWLDISVPDPIVDDADADAEYRQIFEPLGAQEAVLSDEEEDEDEDEETPHTDHTTSSSSESISESMSPESESLRQSDASMHTLSESYGEMEHEYEDID